MSRYAEAHANPSGPGDARPTARQIIKDEGVEGKYIGKSIVITGTSSGIGVETARALAVTGATLFLTARNLTKARTALSPFFDPSRMHLVEMDNESLPSVRAAAAAILSHTPQISILVANAGILYIPTRELTPQGGHERQLACNHLSHFLLFSLLRSALLAASTPALHSRVVVLSSSAHMANGINEPGDYNYEKTAYDPIAAYAQSKTANVYMANEIERRFGEMGLHATSVHPGNIAGTELARYMPQEVVDRYVREGGLGQLMMSVEQGAASTVWAAVSQEFEGRGGRYIDQCREAGPAVGPHEGYAEHAFDEQKEGRLWRDSLVMVGLQEE